MDTVLILAANVVAVLVILLIAVYLSLDKYRFQIERQFTAVEDETYALVCQAGEQAAYDRLRHTAEKLTFLAELWEKGPLVPLECFVEVYNDLAHKYNFRISSRLVKPFAQLLRLRPYPTFR